ncbi:Peptidyl-prolyl cis-trans isomerase, FKBP-type, domain protein [Kalmanozyma brasiliensis GHG001]|uniref:FK506-binding protein n=1 Tax=Kalmanozyma brasiliensis (strain GHG001) TaxID=1365824 RepID=V5EKU5_KALBG|nr:Peptidyl-prolyl cis-trans isomerase, FKBP-type, domain protein [Kalmanozyma brasiliensis GHG001]EST05545.1 Peptidyl-prolyl cis-trans isomerase, FKBP-type, domain protein [Kalmanozyma brasiliensis GHG001]
MAATPIGFFGLKLVPGKIHRMDVSRDFKITNVSYADAPKSNTKTLVKIHYTHVPGFEEDYDEDEDADEEKNPEDEDEIEEKVYTLCSLNGSNKDHAVVDLQFCQEELIGFSITGDAPVDLVGNYVAPPDFFDQEPSDSELYSDDSDDEGMYDLDSDDFDSDDDEEDDDEDMEDPARFEELVESKPKKAIAAAPVAESKKRVAEKPAKETPVKKLKADAAAAPTASATSTPTKVADAKADKQTKTPKDVKSPAATVEKKTAADKPASKMTTTKLPSGLIIEEKSAGTGAPCKPGQKVGMRYVGKLTNGKVFDQCTSGKPFYFKLGKGEVIKGWDEGVKGMKVGAERRLTCPAKLAYGNQKLPGIPANSTLMFDVKLVEIK